jgi:signal transduction histidine kinase
MPENEARFAALRSLLTQLPTANTFDRLYDLACACLGGQLVADSIEMLPDTTAQLPSPSSSDLSWPIVGTGYWLSATTQEPFDEDEIAFANIVANLLSGAPFFSLPEGSEPLTTDGTIDELDELALISTLTKSERSLKPLEATLVGIHGNLMKAFRASSCFIALYDSRGQLVSYPWMLNGGEPSSGEAATVVDSESLLAWSAVNAQAYCSEDLMVDIPPAPAAFGDEVPRSVACVPIRLEDRVLGVISLQSDRAAAFSKDILHSLAAVAPHIAVIIQNAQTHERTNQQLEELSTLYQASATMTANLEQDFVLQAVVAEMVRALKVESCTIYVRDEGTRKLDVAATKHLIGDGLEDDDYANIGLNTMTDLEDHPVFRRVFDTQESVSLRLDSAIGNGEIRLLESAQLESLLLLPLVRRDRVLGLLALGQFSQPRTFSQRELRLARNMAGQAAVAIEHARLFSQAQRRAEELSTFQDIVLQLNTPLQLNAVLDAITESALKLVSATNLHIYLYNTATETFTFGSALWRDGSREPAVPAPRFNGLTGSVVRKAEPVVINDASKHPLFQSAEASTWGICAIAGFPLRHGDQVIGAFTATYLHPHVFTEDERLLLNLLADQAAVAVRNAGLFAGSQRRLRDMSALVDMAKQVTGNLKLNDVLQTTVQILQGLLNARASTITLLSEDETELVVAAAVGVEPAYHHSRMKLGEGISGEVVRKGELIYIRDAHSDPDFLFFDEVIRSLLVVPLATRDQAIGTMTVDSDRPGAFSDSDIQLMTIAAAQVSVAIANARFIEELEARAAELAVAYDELKESDRLKDELVQNVSHELRTPLTFVKGYVDLVLEGEMGELSSRQRESLQIVADKTTDITRLIEDIITLQRINAGNLQLEYVSLSDMLETAVAGHRMVADRKGLTVAHVLPDAPTFVTADKARVNQVLDNLIGNAMKFSPDGGEISITMREVGNEVQIVISDQGIGVPKDKQERIFERFYQVDGTVRRRFGGTGVGLAIVKRIVDAHRGKIWVESEEGRGSSFFVSLPKEPLVERETVTRTGSV